MRIVVALGGNALLQRGEKPDSDIQEHHVAQAAESLAPLCRQHEVVITHGNGPQVGLLALESGSDPSLSHGYPLDALGAQTQGLIGYWLAQALGNSLPGKSFSAIICRTVVDVGEPAFLHPTKFVGQMYAEDVAKSFAAEWGWTVRPDGPGWRRVVPSPRPQEIIELPVLEMLLAAGTGVICCGGGGIPVVRGESGALNGVEAVVDKDRTAGLLARRLNADFLLILTDVPAIQVDFDGPAARPLHHASVTDLRAMRFPDGSMGPKVEAVCDFVEASGKPSAVGRLADAQAILAGNAGTRVTTF